MSKLSLVPEYQGHPLAFDSRPIVLKRDQIEFIEKSLTNLLKEIEDFTGKAFKDKGLLKLLNLPEDLDPEPTPLGLHIPFARFDCLFDGKNLDVLELNTDGTSGWNVMEWIAENSHIPQGQNPNFNLSRRLLDAILVHKPKAPEVVLMDYHGVNTSWEQRDLMRRWENQVTCLMADPKIKAWKDDALVYRRIMSWQLRAQPEKAKAFLEDWSEDKVTVVGGWSSDVGMSKAWPALMKPKYCPETYLMDQKVAGRIENEKDAWILKGVLSFSGHAVIRGMDLKQERWISTLQNIVRETAAGRAWIAQRRVEIPQVDGAPYELGVFFLNGKPSGYMCRWGHSTVINEESKEVLRSVKIDD